MHIQLVNVYLLNVPSVSSLYFNKTKRPYHIGKCHALSLEILCLNKEKRGSLKSWKHSSRNNRGVSPGALRCVLEQDTLSSA